MYYFKKVNTYITYVHENFISYLFFTNFNRLVLLICNFCYSPDVEFCGYVVPHPAEAKMNFRIQMKKGRAVDALKQGLEELIKVCDHVTDVFTTEMNSFKES